MLGSSDNEDEILGSLCHRPEFYAGFLAELEAGTYCNGRIMVLLTPGHLKVMKEWLFDFNLLEDRRKRKSERRSGPGKCQVTDIFFDGASHPATEDGRCAAPIEPPERRKHEDPNCIYLRREDDIEAFPNAGGV